jgi:Spy/CpxP family protein refolding chaperone
MYKKLIAAVVTLALAPAIPALRAEEPHQRHDKGEWKAKLGLSDDQVKKLDDVRTAEKDESKPLREKGHALIEKLKSQIAAKASDSDLKKTLNELAENHKAGEKIEDKYRQRRASIFTPTQQAQMLVARMEHRQKWMDEKKDDNEEKEDQENRDQ